MRNLKTYKFVNAIAIANSHHLYRCSNCDEASFGVPDYCPNCGRHISGEEVTELSEVTNND